MARKSMRQELVMSKEEKKELERLSRSRTMDRRVVERAQILLKWSQTHCIQAVANQVKVTRRTVYKCIDKALALGVFYGLKDLPHRPKAPEITQEAKAWVVSIACTQPKDLGLAAEVWSCASLAGYVKAHAQTQGHPCLNRAAKATVHRILKEHQLQPHKVKYYLEKRDPDFEAKMKDVLIVYKEVQLMRQCANDMSDTIVTVCVDEKPGVQAISNTAPDLPPVAGKHPTISGDHEYVRHGTASILAGIDLHDGHVFAQVHRRHRSVEFIELLKEIDAYYSPDKPIRLILDNHSAHTSKETRAYLATKPNRFIYVHTPKHGSWLNLAETLFGKMARTFLKAIRVASWEELKERILKGVEEFNSCSVLHQWTQFDPLYQNNLFAF